MRVSSTSSASCGEMWKTTSRCPASRREATPGSRRSPTTTSTPSRVVSRAGSRTSTRAATPRRRRAPSTSRPIRPVPPRTRIRGDARRRGSRRGSAVGSGAVVVAVVAPVSGWCWDTVVLLRSGRCVSTSTVTERAWPRLRRAAPSRTQARGAHGGATTGHRGPGPTRSRPTRSTTHEENPMTDPTRRRAPPPAARPARADPRRRGPERPDRHVRHAPRVPPRPRGVRVVGAGDAARRPRHLGGAGPPLGAVRRHPAPPPHAPRTPSTGRCCSPPSRPAAPRPTCAEVRAMREEHADIDPLVTAMRADGFADVVEHPCEEHRNALDIRIAGLREVLDEHLRHEETVVLPLVQRVMTTRGVPRGREGDREVVPGPRHARSSSAGRWTGCPRRPATQMFALAGAPYRVAVRAGASPLRPRSEARAFRYCDGTGTR